MGPQARKRPRAAKKVVLGKRRRAAVGAVQVHSAAAAGYAAIAPRGLPGAGRQRVVKWLNDMRKKRDYEKGGGGKVGAAAADGGSVFGLEGVLEVLQRGEGDADAAARFPEAGPAVACVVASSSGDTILSRFLAPLCAQRRVPLLWCDDIAAVLTQLAGGAAAGVPTAAAFAEAPEGVRELTELTAPDGSS